MKVFLLVVLALVLSAYGADSSLVEFRPVLTVAACTGAREEHTSSSTTRPPIRERPLAVSSNPFRYVGSQDVRSGYGRFRSVTFDVTVNPNLIAVDYDATVVSIMCDDDSMTVQISDASASSQWVVGAVVSGSHLWACRSGTVSANQVEPILRRITSADFDPETNTVTVQTVPAALLVRISSPTAIAIVKPDTDFRSCCK
jgi:hypothetical protein